MTDMADEKTPSAPKNALPGKIGDTRSVKYSAPGSKEFYKIGGTRAWRNNGCGLKAKSYGAIGCDGSRAIFPDEAAGVEAHKKLLTDDKYKDHTLADAIEQWAPPSENPTERYIATVARRTGIPMDKIIRDMTPDECVY